MPVVNPIEHSAMAPKSLKTSLNNVAKIHRLEMAEAQVAEELKAETRRKALQTVKTQKSDQMEYRYDQKDGSNNGGSSQSKKKQEHQRDDEDDVAAKLGRSFDIRI